jgi:hypothetical protein
MLKPNDNVYTMLRTVLEEVAKLDRKEQMGAVNRAEQWCTETLVYVRKDLSRGWEEKEEDYRWWVRAETMFCGASFAGQLGVNFRYWEE